jgi:hypothetical protein
VAVLCALLAIDEIVDLALCTLPSVFLVTGVLVKYLPTTLVLLIKSCNCLLCHFGSGAGGMNCISDGYWSSTVIIIFVPAYGMIGFVFQSFKNLTLKLLTHILSLSLIMVN